MIFSSVEARSSSAIRSPAAWYMRLEAVVERDELRLERGDVLLGIGHPRGDRVVPGDLDDAGVVAAGLAAQSRARWPAARRRASWRRSAARRPTRTGRARSGAAGRVTRRSTVPGPAPARRSPCRLTVENLPATTVIWRSSSSGEPSERSTVATCVPAYWRAASSPTWRAIGGSPRHLRGGCRTARRTRRRETQLLLSSRNSSVRVLPASSSSVRKRPLAGDGAHAPHDAGRQRAGEMPAGVGLGGLAHTRPDRLRTVRRLNEPRPESLNRTQTHRY